MSTPVVTTRAKYCYASLATHKSREEFTHPRLRESVIANLAGEAAKLKESAKTGQVLLCFTCDPYQHLDAIAGITRASIAVLHANGFSVCALTKGGSRALRDLDLFTSQDAFASTLTFLDEAKSLEWEPGAALPQDRIDTLRAFHEAGIPTWVSLEPVIDPEQSLQLIREACAFVDLFKIGKLNYHPLAKAIDWAKFAKQAVAWLNSLGYRRLYDPPAGSDVRVDVATHAERRYYIKRDLAQYL